MLLALVGVAGLFAVGWMIFLASPYGWTGRLLALAAGAMLALVLQGVFVLGLSCVLALHARASNGMTSAVVSVLFRLVIGLANLALFLLCALIFVAALDPDDEIVRGMTSFGHGITVCWFGLIALTAGSLALACAMPNRFARRLNRHSTQ